MSRQGRSPECAGHSNYQLFLKKMADPGPSKGPFWKKMDFEGDPKILIFGTESTKVCSTNSINPCIKATLGPTSLILEGSDKLCFFGRFPIGQKGVQKSMDETVWRLLGAKRVHDTSTQGSDLREGPLGLASRARRLED